MIGETLEHLTDDGIMVVQFGELDFEDAPNRTSRYLVTARRRPRAARASTTRAHHLLVAAELNDGRATSRTIVVKRTPFTAAESDGFTEGSSDIPLRTYAVAPGRAAACGDHVVSRLAGGTDAEVDAIVAAYPSDDRRRRRRPPVLLALLRRSATCSRDIFEPVDDLDPEDAIGERVLLLLLGFAVALRGGVPAAAVRRRAADVVGAAGEGRRRRSTSPASGSASCSSRSR